MNTSMDKFFDTLPRLPSAIKIALIEVSKNGPPFSVSVKVAPVYLDDFHHADDVRYTTLAALLARTTVEKLFGSFFKKNADGSWYKDFTSNDLLLPFVEGANFLVVTGSTKSSGSSSGKSQEIFDYLCKKFPSLPGILIWTNHCLDAKARDALEQYKPPSLRLYIARKFMDHISRRSDGYYYPCADETETPDCPWAQAKIRCASPGYDPYEDKSVVHIFTANFKE